jgi:hypothetical protein
MKLDLTRRVGINDDLTVEVYKHRYQCSMGNPVVDSVWDRRENSSASSCFLAPLRSGGPFRLGRRLQEKKRGTLML